MRWVPDVRIERRLVCETHDSAEGVAFATR